MLENACKAWNTTGKGLLIHILVINFINLSFSLRKFEILENLLFSEYVGAYIAIAIQ